MALFRSQNSIGAAETTAGVKTCRLNFVVTTAMEDQEPLRILIVLECPSIDGIAKPMLEFARQAARPRPDGQRVAISFVIFTRRQPVLDNTLTQAALACGATLYRIDEWHVFDLRVIGMLRDAVRRSRTDIIVTNGAKAHFLVRMSGLDQGMLRWVAFHHGYTFTNQKVEMYNVVGRWSMRRAHRVLAVCAAFADELERGGVPRGRIGIQGLPIRQMPAPPDGFGADLRLRLDIPEGAPLVVAVGRLSNEKGHADLIRAVAQLRDQHLWPALRVLILGEGPEMSRLKQLSAKLGVGDMVRLPGFQENVSHYLGVADLFVLPSHSEGSPNALLEAMAAGVPVVATAVGGVPEIVRDEHNGLLVGSGDVGAMAAAMSRILTDPTLGSRLALAGRAVLESHTPENFFSSMLSNLQS